MSGNGMTVLYLHGFASSPQSSKATFLRDRFAERGVPVHTPDLNLPDFSTLTVSRMLEQVGERIDSLAPGPLVVIGSSLGGFVAVQTAVRYPDRVQSLVLLAPALDFGPTAPQGLSLADWRRAGTLNVYHYAYGRPMAIHYALYDDAARYDAMQADLRMPVLVFQGKNDEAVDPATVDAWSRQRPNVQLHMLDDDHQLSHSLDYIWTNVAAFVL
jgi:pimeloyl-ACP methyl ester carboxylesterase